LFSSTIPNNVGLNPANIDDFLLENGSIIPEILRLSTWLNLNKFYNIEDLEELLKNEPFLKVLVGEFKPPCCLEGLNNIFLASDITLTQSLISTFNNRSSTSFSKSISVFFKPFLVYLQDDNCGLLWLGYIYT
jgi:hypothetical protein